MTRIALTTLPAHYTSLPTEDGVGTTSLAQALNAAMADSAERRAEYAAIYGVEWEPLPYFPTTVRLYSTTAATVR